MWHDVVLALRSLRRQPAFAMLVIGVLAIGIGAATAIANVYDTVLLRRLPVHDQDRLVVMWGASRARSFDHVPLNSRRLRDLRERTRALLGVAAADYNGAWPRLFRDGSEPLELNGLPVSGEFFDVIGTSAFLGRALRPADDVRGAPATMVISHATWKGRFGGSREVLGRTMYLVSSGTNFTIVGVMPPGFEYPIGAQFWTTIAAATGAGSADARAFVDVIGRLRPGATLEEARAELSRFFSSDSSEFFRDVTGVARTLPDLVVGDVGPALRILGFAVALLLIVACVNATNLFLIRGVDRAREMAVRHALGAGRTRLIRLLFTESSIMACAAGVLGAVIAVVLLRVLLATAPSELPRLAEVRIGSSVWWAIGATLLVAMVVGIGPALWTAGARTSASRVGGSRWATEGRGERRVRDVLAAGQLALGILILTSAALVTRSLVRLQQLDVGYSTDHVLVAQLGWPTNKYSEVTRAIAMYDAVVAETERIPGVVSAAPLLTGPFSGTGGWDGGFVVDGQRGSASDRNPMLNMEVGSPGFFTTMGIGLRSGRVFSAVDRGDSPRVVILSEGAARALWPAEEAVGKRLRGASDGAPWLTVVGVAGDTRYREFRTPRPTIYYPLHQLPFPYPPTNLVLRTSSDDPASITSALRRAVVGVDPDIVIARTSTMRALLDRPLAQPRMNALLLGVFAGVVVILAAVGLYGVLAWMVRQRSRELGIRMALGASPAQVVSMVMRRGMAIAALGTALGVAGALATSRFLGALLYEISPTDPLTIVASSGLLLLVALLATLTPARRAMRVDPVVTLRND